MMAADRKNGTSTINIRTLPLRNLSRKPVRTAALVILSAFLAFAVFAGSLVVLSLKNGLKSLEGRLGADVIVVPSSAAQKVDLDEILLQGAVGYFYMDSSKMDKIVATEGVEQASAQIFLASLRADCCSVAVQVIGIDQDTDFVVQPWISQQYQDRLQELEVVVGCEVSAEVGENIRIYGENCRVVARLSETGTGMDTAIYTNYDTIRTLLTAAESLGHDLKISGDPENVISAVYVKVAEGYDIETVRNNLNVYVRKTKAVQTKSMITSVSDGLSGIASAVIWLIAGIAFLAFAILTAVFCLLIHERKREFAVLRLIGTSAAASSGVVIREALVVSLGGSVLGAAFGGLLIGLFSTLIQERLGLPFLLPGWEQAGVAALATIALTMAAGILASGYAAFRLGKVDAGNVLREGN